MQGRIGLASLVGVSAIFLHMFVIRSRRNEADREGAEKMESDDSDQVMPKKPRKNSYNMETAKVTAGAEWGHVGGETPE